MKTLTKRVGNRAKLCRGSEWRWSRKRGWTGWYLLSLKDWKLIPPLLLLVGRHTGENKCSTDPKWRLLDRVDTNKCNANGNLNFASS